MSCELFISWNPDLVAFHLGPLSFRWYSLCWLIGLALAYIVVKKLFKDQKIPDEKFDPLFIYCFLGILIGARLGHCLFYQPEDYLTSVKGFIEMLLPIHFLSSDGWDWKMTGYEGLASHGGTLGLIIALWLYVRKTKVPLWQVLDNIAIATGTTACFIRLGNLMNSEIIGSTTSVPWAFEFVARDGLPRHPAQLYEAMAYGLLFFIMLWLYKKHKERVGTGFYFGLCLTFIFTFRFFVEFFKKEQVDFEANMLLDMGQILSIPFVLVGAYCMRRSLRKAAAMLALCLAVSGTVKAQAATPSHYDQTMKLGRMMEQSGNTLLAGQCYRQAVNLADEKDTYRQLLAQLGWVSTQKFINPVEAQRLNDELEKQCRNYPDCRQLHLALNGFLSFRFNNRETFTRDNDEYVRLCKQNESLPSTFDLALQAMGEALAGYYDQALKTLDRPGTDPVTRHDLRTVIFEMNGDTIQLIREMRRRAETIDSLNAVMYEQNASQANTVAAIAGKELTASRAKTVLLLGLLLIAAFAAITAYLVNKAKKKSKMLLAKKNQQLEASLKMAGETNEMKMEFVRRVSHEIRTPLNAIAGFNEILNNPTIEMEQKDREELVARINENVKAITNIVDEMLEVANDVSQAGYAKDTTVLCNQFFRDMFYKHRPEVSADVQLEFTTQVLNRQAIKINASAVEKVLEHLIRNAIKFTQQGIIELNCREDERMIRLTLTDTGSGIPEEKRDSIFEHFTKVNDHQQGIGLGLTVARSIARKIGGELSLDQSYNSGARFVFTLPKE